MLPFNAFSTHDLVAVMVTAPLAVIFYVAYWKFGRRTVDGLFAGLMSCNAAICLVIFMVDNVVPAGSSPLAVPGAAESTLLWARAMYLIGLLVMPIQLHFVLRYCRLGSFLSRHVWLLYAVFLLAAPGVWSEWFLQQRSQPVGEVASWRNAVPWMPQPGPLLGIYLGTWLGVQVLIQVLLHLRREAPRRGRGALTYVRLIRLGFLAQAAGGLADMVLGASGYTGVAVLPFTTMVMGVIAGTALVRERASAERQRDQIEREMELAARIQRRLLPPSGPAIEGFELAGWSRPATQTVGDTYDFFALPEGRWLITLGDATGHGLGPALVVSEARALLRATASRSARPSQILYEVDQLLGLDLVEGRFVTCFVGVLDAPAGRLSYASAGQGPILFYDRSAGRFSPRETTAPPLGVSLLSAPGRDDPHWQFRPGDFLALVSDGFYEATNVEGVQFGLKRLQACLLGGRDLPAAGMIDRLRDEVQRFAGTAGQDDDLTIVVLRRL